MVPPSEASGEDLVPSLSYSLGAGTGDLRENIRFWISVGPESGDQ